MNKNQNSLLCTMLIVVMIASIAVVPAAFAEEDREITVFVDGALLQFDVNPVAENGRTLVPMRFIFEALGAEVTWDDVASEATAVKGEDTIVIGIDSLVMKKNGGEILLDVPAKLIGGRTLVPVRAVSEGLGAKVEWNEELLQVLITTGQPAGNISSDPSEDEKPSEEKDTKKYDYQYTELSEKDMADLKASYNNLIRYGFEQKMLPKAVFENMEDIKTKISEQSSKAEQLARDVWNNVVIAKIMEIQMESESSYLVNITNEAELRSGYLSVVEKADLEATGYFDTSYKMLKDNSNMLLITFKKTDALIACKYIGIVVRPDKTVRYFTAETDLTDKDHLYFCEVTAKGRGTLFRTDFEKETFVSAVNHVIEKNIGIE